MPLSHFMYWLTNFVAKHILGLIAISLLLSLSGTVIAVLASTKAASAQSSTLLLTQAQGDQIKALTNLTKNETDLSNQLAQENNNRLKDDANLLCGGFVPISKLNPPPGTSAIGLSLIQWAKGAALALNCPPEPTPSVSPTPTPTPTR